jgi:predicted oxidoreductase
MQSGGAPRPRTADPVAGDLIGVKLHILIQKTLGGIQTDLSSRAPA